MASSATNLSDSDVRLVGSLDESPIVLINALSGGCGRLCLLSFTTGTPPFRRVRSVTAEAAGSSPVVAAISNQALTEMASSRHRHKNAEKSALVGPPTAVPA
jgi:hypothetical protein